MGRELQIKPISLVPKWKKGINITPIDDTEKVSFNFRRLKTNNCKFDYTAKEKQYFIKLIERLKAVCDFSHKQLVTSTSKSLRCHKIDFKDCTENGFGLISEDLDEEAFQIEISEHEHGRIHGYFVGNIFYVVWLDPQHELYK